MSYETIESQLLPLEDQGQVSEVVVAAALAGDQPCRDGVRAVLAGLDEPYRTVATELLRLYDAEGYVDGVVLANALTRYQLRRRVGDRLVAVPANEVIRLLTSVPVDATRARAYLTVLREADQRYHAADFADSCRQVIERLGNSPEALGHALESLVRGRNETPADPAEQHPCELLDFVPYVCDLDAGQDEGRRQGLDTGFEHLNHLCNGLDAGLFVLAAPPAIGKTTLAFQLACQVAALNRVPVLYYSLEQGKRELRAKAIARLGRLNYSHVLRRRYTRGDALNWAKIEDALRQYLPITPYLTIVEGTAATTVAAVTRDVVRVQEELNTRRTLVLIDYLQIMPVGERDEKRLKSPREKVDFLVSELRRLARERGVTVLAISSQNRSGYTLKTMDVFKESGGIEYGSDIAAVLNHYPALDNKECDHVGRELSILKNRNGERGVVRFKFYPAQARFVDEGQGPLEETVV